MSDSTSPGETQEQLELLNLVGEKADGSASWMTSLDAPHTLLRGLQLHSSLLSHRDLCSRNCLSRERRLHSSFTCTFAELEAPRPSFPDKHTANCRMEYYSAKTRDTVWHSSIIMLNLKYSLRNVRSKMVRVPKHDVLEGIARGTIKIDSWLQDKGISGRNCFLLWLWWWIQEELHKNLPESSKNLKYNIS